MGGVGEEDAEFYPEDEVSKKRPSDRYDARDRIRRKEKDRSDSYYRESSRGSHSYDRRDRHSKDDRRRSDTRDMSYYRKERSSERKSIFTSAVQIPDKSNNQDYDSHRYQSGEKIQNEEDRIIEERLRQIDLELNKRDRSIKEEFKENKDPGRRRGMGLKSPPRARRIEKRDNSYSSSSRSRSRSSDEGSRDRKGRKRNKGKKIFADAPTALVDKNRRGHR